MPEQQEENLLTTYQAETKLRIETIEQVLTHWGNPFDGLAEDLHLIFRQIHTIKGGAGFLDLRQVSQLCHGIESFLAYLREHQHPLNSEVRGLLLEGVALLKRLFIAEVASLSEEIRHYTEQLQRNFEVHSDIREFRQVKNHLCTLEKSLDHLAVMEGKAELFNLTNCLQAIDALDLFARKDGLPAAQGWLQVLYHFYSEAAELKEPLSLANILRIQRLLLQLRSLILHQGQEPSSLAPLDCPPTRLPAQNSWLDQSERLEGLILRQLQATSSLEPEKQRQFNELYSAWQDLKTRLFTEEPYNFDDFLTLLRQRVIEWGAAQGKEIELKVRNEILRLPPAICKDMQGPLLHLVRNACVHGIERVKKRQEEKKHPQGLIQLELKSTDDQYLIQVKDDGQGLDLNQLKEVALSQGLHNPEELAAMSDAEIESLIYRPGFSSNLNPDLASGRGVGLDAVQDWVAQSQGKMTHHSQAGQGMSFQITLPSELIPPPLPTTKLNKMTSLEQKNNFHESRVSQ